MVLREEDFAGWRINWQDKARNIADLAKELNLGLQSVVFIDDNPVERGRVKEALPEVLVPEWPEDKHLYASTLLGLRCFDSGQLSAEDQQRTKMMRDQRQRQQNAPNLGSLEEWIESLQMQVKAELLSPNNLPRTAQLLNKTNQMNLSTRRLTEAELTAWVSAGQRELWVVNVTDRFGDSGLTGIVSIEAEGDTGRIVDYLLSCRVMGRNVEELLLHIAVYAARQRGLRTLQARLVPTAKNKPCLDFMLRSGFNQTGEHEFEWDLSREYPAPRAVALNLAAGAAA
jgi:FkbH-like protein